MPHQCLKCGKVFPSGSPEILKGCGNCGGKKFFYTEQAVSEEERIRLTEQANKDIKVLIHEILSQRGEPLTKYDSGGQELPTSGWVKISPVGAGKEPKVEPVPGGIGSEAGLGPEAFDANGHPSVKALLKELRETPELGLELPSEEGKAAAEKEKPEIVKTRPKKKGKVKLRKRKKKGLRKATHRPEVIKVVEPGVYEIYLSKLLKNFPIIINRDGTYLVHLPSVFDKMERDKK